MISILVPVYKTEDYLMQCLCSVAKQTYTDYEIVIINDGSPGDCDSIVQEFRTQYPEIRIKYVIQENAGIAAVRNKGLDLDCNRLAYPQIIWDCKWVLALNLRGSHVETMCPCPSLHLQSTVPGQLWGLTRFLE